MTAAIEARANTGSPSSSSPFAAVTIATIVGLTLFACLTGYQVRGQWPERGGNNFTALALTLIGALVLGGIV